VLGFCACAGAVFPKEYTCLLMAGDEITPSSKIAPAMADNHILCIAAVKSIISNKDKLTELINRYI
jgi:hypothetical protein